MKVQSLLLGSLGRIALYVAFYFWLDADEWSTKEKLFYFVLCSLLLRMYTEEWHRDREMQKLREDLRSLRNHFYRTQGHDFD